MDFHLYPDISLSAHELSSLERNNVASFDLLTQDANELARKTKLSLEAVERITNAVISQSLPKANRTARDNYHEQRFLTTGDGNLDEIMGGGAPLQHITEFVGESGVGKSQFMTQFCITVQLPVSLGGLNKEVVYISTESGLATTRAKEIVAGFLKRFPDQELLLPLRPLDRIHVVVCPDLELQDHMMYYQLPVLLKKKRGKIGAVIIDSIAANYRAEHEGRSQAGGGSDRRAGDMAQRSKELTRLSAHLRKLAVDFNLAVIVANQVSDRINNGYENNVLSLDHQAQWFTGWRTNEYSSKTPALGLVWANAVHCRVALKKVGGMRSQGEETPREMMLVYSPFAAQADVRYKIVADGVRSA